MKKFLSNNLKFIIIGIVLAIGASYAVAQLPFNAGNNTPLPINVGADDQAKSAGLTVDTFAARGSAQLAQSMTLLGTVFGGTPDGYTDSSGSMLADCAGDYSDAKPVDLCFGGRYATGGPLQVGVAATGALAAQGTLTFANLGNNHDENICADPQGNVILCDQIQDVCPNLPGVQESVPQFYTKNAAGNCLQNDLCPNIPGAQTTLPVGYTIDSSGNCTQSTNIVAYVNLTRQCDAQRNNHGADDFFGNVSDGTDGTGTYDLAIQFSKPLPIATNLGVKVCTEDPWAYLTGPFNGSIFSGSSSVYHVVRCNNVTKNGTAPSVSDSPYTGVSAQDISNAMKSAKPNTFSIPAYTTDYTISNIPCSRAGLGNKLKWSFVGAIDAQFSPAGQNNTQQETINLLTGNIPISTYNF